jgi:hypothetical protein
MKRMMATLMKVKWRRIFLEGVFGYLGPGHYNGLYDQFTVEWVHAATKK